MDTTLQALIGIALGLGLAASAGFRVFVPLLVAAVAARLGVLPLADGFQWLAGTPALVTLGVAALAETAAYFIPGSITRSTWWRARRRSPPASSRARR